MNVDFLIETFTIHHNAYDKLINIYIQLSLENKSKNYKLRS